MSAQNLWPLPPMLWRHLWTTNSIWLFDLKLELILTTAPDALLCHSEWPLISFVFLILLFIHFFCLGVNFINVQRAAFTLEDPKSVKNTDGLNYVNWTLLGSACIKAARKALMKLNPDDATQYHFNKFSLFWLNFELDYFLE